MKKCFIFAVCAVTIFFAACSAFAAPEKTVDVITYAGDVKVTAPGTEAPVDCKAGMSLAQGTKLVTGGESYVDIAFDAKAMNIVRVGEKTQVVIKLDRYDKIELVNGELYASLTDMKKGETFRIKTPCATCGARGTAWKTATTEKATDISVVKDQVYVRGMNRDGSVMEGELLVKEGFETSVDKFDRPDKATRMSEERMADIEKDITPIMKGAEQEAEKKEDTVEGVPSAEGTAAEGTKEAAVKAEAEGEKEAGAVKEAVTEVSEMPEKEEAVSEMKERAEETQSAAEVRQEKASEIQETTQERLEQKTEAIETRTEAREEQKETLEDQKEEQRLEEVEKGEEPKPEPADTSTSGGGAAVSRD